VEASEVICAACHRPLKKPAKQHGKAMYGPVCAARYFGKLIGGTRQTPERDDKTCDLFEDKKGDKA
jgi:hypothetical protein